MEVKERPSVEKPKTTAVKKRKKKKKKINLSYITTAFMCMLVIAVIISSVVLKRMHGPKFSIFNIAGNDNVSLLDPTSTWKTGYVATLKEEAIFFDMTGAPAGTLLRGATVKYETNEAGTTEIAYDGIRGYLQEGAYVVENISEVIPPHKLYVRSAVNLRNAEGRIQETFIEKGESVNVTGCDYFDEDGQVHMYSVEYEGQSGYIMPWYLANKKGDALENYDGDGNYYIHENRKDHYGGGHGGNLDYFPREKAVIEGNEMPEEVHALYLVSWVLHDIDKYLEIARDSGINTFVVDITDGSSLGYVADVMTEYCPSSVQYANNSLEYYKSAIEKIKAEGYYLVGRITTFNDLFFVMDNPDCAITDNFGEPMMLHGAYWPTAFSRKTWQYKVDLAVEAVELMGFNEIQFDYVRFPDLTMGYEEAGTIDFHNQHGETKAQAIQRFLMYATDIIHEHGAYVSADVYGESAYSYVTAYGQYWPAISNVVDAISGMPYPDHFERDGDWRPWEHPYEALLSWGESAMTRQAETASPAIVRTWIQAYDAIKPPYNGYGPEEILAQVNGLRDAGCTGGYMTWNVLSDVNKYTSLLPAFDK